MRSRPSLMFCMARNGMRDNGMVSDRGIFERNFIATDLSKCYNLSFTAAHVDPESQRKIVIHKEGEIA